MTIGSSGSGVAAATSKAADAAGSTASPCRLRMGTGDALQLGEQESERLGVLPSRPAPSGDQPERTGRPAAPGWHSA